MPAGPPTPQGPRPVVVVVGGGIAGLSAAYELTGGTEADPQAPAVVVCEETERLGGKIRTEKPGQRVIEVGPDGFLGRRPEATDLCRAIGLGDKLEPIGARGAAVWARGRRRRLPESLALGIPTKVLPVARSGILSFSGILRLARDRVVPRRNMRGPLGDRAIGPLVARKLGQPVVNALVDPLVGGIHAGGVADMSTAAVYPVLLAASMRRGSLLHSLRRATKPGKETESEEVPAFWSLRTGLESLPRRLGEVLEERGVTVRMKAPVSSIEIRNDHRWVIEAGGEHLEADGVVIAVPPTVAGALLRDVEADAATLLSGIDTASVALLCFAYPADAFAQPLEGTGFLVPTGTRLGDTEPALVTAVTYLSQKWPHLDREGELLVRASVGRFADERFEQLDDDALVAQVVKELSVLLDTDVTPEVVTVTRWPHSFPQYRVHHLLRVSGIEAALRRVGTIALAGAASRGVGIPACIASGRDAARAVLEELGTSRPRLEPTP